MNKVFTYIDHTFITEHLCIYEIVSAVHKPDPIALQTTLLILALKRSSPWVAKDVMWTIALHAWSMRDEPILHQALYTREETFVARGDESEPMLHDAILTHHTALLGGYPDTEYDHIFINDTTGSNSWVYDTGDIKASVIYVGYHPDNWLSRGRERLAFDVLSSYVCKPIGYHL